MNMKDNFPQINPRPTDVIVAVMGMTGSGKSTFISLCSGEEVPVGHNLQACTQQVTWYRCKYTDQTDIYLVDTPGFDDTNRLDTDVLKEIATWLTGSYSQNVKLNGILYLHRITDPRMQGSAKKNLFMFKKLCGNTVLKNVLLVSTMWEIAKETDATRREKELIDTEDFWGVLVRAGAKVERHNNSRDSAFRLLKQFVKKERVTMSIQQEMVNEHKSLDQTAAGIELESELRKEREKFRKELAEAQEMMKQALEARDQESAEMLRQHNEEMSRKIDKIVREREQLKVSMEKMHADRFAKLEQKYEQQQARIRRQEEENRKEIERHRKMEEETRRELERVKQSERDRARLSTENQQLQKKLDETLQLMGNLTIPNTQSPASPAPSTSTTAGTGSGAVQYRTRSAPGPNRINEYACVALAGSSYYFVGPAWDYHRRPKGLTKAYSSDQSARYVAFGIEGSWYYHYHVSGECYTQWSMNLKDHYPTLVTWMNDKKLFGCPHQVTLGLDGNFYMRTENGYWNYILPRKVTDRAGNFSNVKRVWLGYDDAYVIETKDQWLWNLRNHYGDLDKRIKEYDGVKDLAMNLYDPTGYIIISNSGACGWNVGAGDYAFEEFSFQEYMSKNFGSVW